MSHFDFHTARPLQLVVNRPAAAVATDAEIVQGLVSKEEWAAVALWTRYGTMVYRLADRALGAPEEAEDLTQDVFLCVFGKIATLRDPKAVRSYLVSVTIRLLKWKLRRMRLRQWVRLTESGTLPEQTANGADAEDTVRRFYRILARLDVRDRLVFVLRHVDGQRLEEVAQATGCSLATVKRRLIKAKDQLATWVERDPVLTMFLQNEGGHR